MHCNGNQCGPRGADSEPLGPCAGSCNAVSRPDLLLNLVFIRVWLCRVVRQSEDEAASVPSASDGGDVDMEGNAASEAARPVSAGTSYRLGSVGQDCQLCMWDIVVQPPRHRLAHASRSAPLQANSF
jgi:hypothetical protein